jgi:linoleoyl-CoA desaturase
MAFQFELRRRVAEYFGASGRRERDCWQMYVKTAVLIAGFAGAYGLLVFAARTWIEGAVLAVLLGLFAAGIGLNIQHDGGHRAYSSRPWVNRVAAMTLELIGGAPICGDGSTACSITPTSTSTATTPTSTSRRSPG